MRIKRFLAIMFVVIASLCLYDIVTFRGTMCIAYPTLSPLRKRSSTPEEELKYATFVMTDLSERRKDLAKSIAHQTVRQGVIFCLSVVGVAALFLGKPKYTN